MSDQSDKKRASNQTADEHTRKRSRNEESRETFYSRLDALARILEGASTCTALTSITDSSGEKKIWIASNNLHKKSGKNQYLDQIKTVMNYFKGLSEEKTLSKKERIILLKNIFERQCKNSTKGAIPIPDFIIENVIKLVVDRKDNTLTFNMRDIDSKHIEATGLTLASFGRFYRDFCKLEESAIPDGELNDFFKQDYEILKEADTPGVHAEMQLLDKLIQEKIYENKGNDQVYFAISKLCCFRCNELLEATNEVFKDESNKLNILFAGTHGLDPKWKAPSLLDHSELADAATAYHSDSEDIASEATEQHMTIREKIKHIATKRIEQKSTWSYKKDVYMARSVSSVESSVNNNEKIFNKIRVKLNSMMENIKKVEELSERKSVQFLSSGLNLIQLDSYKVLLSEDNLASIDLNDFVDHMFIESQKDSAQQIDCFTSKNELIKFLCMPGMLPDTVIDKLEPLLHPTGQRLVAFNAPQDQSSSKQPSTLLHAQSPSLKTAEDKTKLTENDDLDPANQDDTMEVDPGSTPSIGRP